MILRSGKSINGLKNTKFNKDAMLLTSGDNTANTPQYGYCKNCFLIFALFEFMEKYHKDLRGEERTIHGKSSHLPGLYLAIRAKLEEFIDCIDRQACSCNCEEQDILLEGTIYRNICLMETLSRLAEYKEMANYCGYGKDREMYRLYHKNFFIIEEVAEEEEDEDGEARYIITRDFHMTRNELLHWLGYFRQEHQTVIDAARKALRTYKNGYIPDDCIGQIIKFL